MGPMWDALAVAGPDLHLCRVAYGSMVAGDWASIALPVELDANGTGAAVVEAPLAPVNLQQVDANDLDKVLPPDPRNGCGACHPIQGSRRLVLKCCPCLTFTYTLTSS